MARDSPRLWPNPRPRRCCRLEASGDARETQNPARRRLSPIRVSAYPQLVMDRSAMLAVVLLLVTVGAAPAASASAIPATRRAACPRLQWRALRPAEV